MIHYRNMPTETVSISDGEEKRTNKIVEDGEEDDILKNKNIDELDEDSEEEDDDEEDEDEDEDEEDEDEDEEEDEDEDEMENGLTDVGLYNVLGGFLVDESGNSIATSLSKIAKELSRLNSNLKSYSKTSK